MTQVSRPPYPGNTGELGVLVFSVLFSELLAVLGE